MLKTLHKDVEMNCVCALWETFQISLMQFEHWLVKSENLKNSKISCIFTQKCPIYESQQKKRIHYHTKLSTVMGPIHFWSLVQSFKLLLLAILKKNLPSWSIPLKNVIVRKWQENGKYKWFSHKNLSNIFRRYVFLTCPIQ